MQPSWRLFAWALLLASCDLFGGDEAARRASDASAPPPRVTERSARARGGSCAEPREGRLSVGDDAACAVRGEELWCWGAELYGWPLLDNPRSLLYRCGELVSDLLPHGPIPIPRDTVPSVVSVGLQTCVADVDGAVECISRTGDDGRLGGDARNRKGGRRSIDLPAAARMLVSEETHTCALLSDGSVACWGQQPGWEWITGPSPALRAPGEPLVGMVHLGMDSAIDADGTLFLLSVREIEPASRPGRRPRREPVLALIAEPRESRPVLDVTRSAFSLCTLDAAGVVDCATGDVRAGRRMFRGQPIGEPLPPVRQIDCDSGTCCVVTRDARLICWGAGSAEVVAHRAHHVDVGRSTICYESPPPECEVHCWTRVAGMLGPAAPALEWIRMDLPPP